MSFRVGAYFPYTEIENDVSAITDFVQSVEELGFDFLSTADHVLGANRASRPDWDGPYDLDSQFYEPLVFYSFLSGITKRIEFMPAVIIAPQRQTALLAKQSANLDMFCGGRLQLGFGTGWNPVEYQALGVDLKARGKRLEDQIHVLRELWTKRSVTVNTDFHTINDAGLWPMPVQQPIPIWLGGTSPIAMRRAARMGDGWIPFLTADDANEKIDRFFEEVEAAGRSRSDVKFENMVHLGSSAGGPRREVEDVVSDVQVWQKAGADGVCLGTMDRGLKGAKDHLEVLRTIAEEIGLEKP